MSGAVPVLSAALGLRRLQDPVDVNLHRGPVPYFSDYIDEFRVWNIARSAADITSTMKKTLVGNEAGLVGYWQFNESSGTSPPVR